MTLVSFKQCLLKMGISAKSLREDEKELIAQKFEEWSCLVSVNIWNKEDDKYIIAFLPKKVEEVIEKAWEKSASYAYFLEELAIALCLCSMELALGKTRVCLPLPLLTSKVKVKLESMGVTCKDKIMLKYAIFTYFSVLKKCESCILERGCCKKHLQTEGADS